MFRARRQLAAPMKPSKPRDRSAGRIVIHQIERNRICNALLICRSPDRSDDLVPTAKAESVTSSFFGFLASAEGIARVLRMWR